MSYKKDNVWNVGIAIGQKKLLNYIPVVLSIYYIFK